MSYLIKNYIISTTISIQAKNGDNQQGYYNREGRAVQLPGAGKVLPLISLNLILSYILPKIIFGSTVWILALPDASKIFEY